MCLKDWFQKIDVAGDDGGDEKLIKCLEVGLDEESGAFWKQPSQSDREKEVVGGVGGVAVVASAVAVGSAAPKAKWE